MAPTADERLRVDASQVAMLGRAAMRVASARNSSGTLTPSSAARLREDLLRFLAARPVRARGAAGWLRLPF